MQPLHKSAIALLVLIGIQGSALAYRWSFSNHTAETFKIRFQLAADGDWWPEGEGRVMEPGAYVEEWFPWIHEKITDWEHNRRAGFCMNTIQIAFPKKDAQGKPVLVQGKSVWTPWKEVNIEFVESNQQKKMVKASDQFVTGASNVGLSAAGQDGSGQAEGLGKAIGTFVGYSPCKNRHYEIIDLNDGEGIRVISLAQ